MMMMIIIIIIIINKPIAHKRKNIVITNNLPLTHTWKTWLFWTGTLCKKTRIEMCNLFTYSMEQSLS